MARAPTVFAYSSIICWHTSVPGLVYDDLRLSTLTSSLSFISLFLRHSVKRSNPLLPGKSENLGPKLFYLSFQFPAFPLVTKENQPCLDAGEESPRSWWPARSRGSCQFHCLRPPIPLVAIDSFGRSIILQNTNLP